MPRPYHAKLQLHCNNNNNNNNNNNSPDGIHVPRVKNNNDNTKLQQNKQFIKINSINSDYNKFLSDHCFGMVDHSGVLRSQENKSCVMILVTLINDHR